MKNITTNILGILRTNLSKTLLCGIPQFVVTVYWGFILGRHFPVQVSILVIEWRMLRFWLLVVDRGYVLDKVMDCSGCFG